MKTVFKRLLSFVLVAMMLVSVLPFQASAAGSIICVNQNGTTFEAAIGDDGKLTADALTSLGNNSWVTWGGSDALTANSTPTAGTYYYMDGASYNWQVKITCGGNVYTAYTQATEGAGPAIDVCVNAVTSQITDLALYDTSSLNTEAAWTYNTTPPMTVSASLTRLSGNVTVKASYDNVEQSDTRELTNKTSVTYDEILAAGRQIVGPDVPGDASYVPTGIKVDGKDFTGSMNVTSDVTAVVYFAKYNEESVNFYTEQGGQPQTLYTQQGKLTSLPETPTKNHYVFQRWCSDPTGVAGITLTNKNDYDITDGVNSYYAIWSPVGNVPNGDDEVSTLTIKAYFYVGNRFKKQAVVWQEDLADGSSIGAYLVNKIPQIRQEIFNIDGITPEMYEWEETFYFNDTFTGDEVKLSDEMKGNKTLFVKVQSLEADQVMLYVHDTYSVNSYKTIIEMKDYVEGDWIYSADIKEALKNKYPNATYSFTGMYTDDSWKDFVTGKSGTTAVTSLQVKRDEADRVRHSAFNIHVYVKKVSTNNSDNPKTGDAILMAVTVLGVSASALAVAYYLNKKKHTV